MYTVYINWVAPKKPFRVPVDAAIVEFPRGESAAERFSANIIIYDPLSCSRRRHGGAMKVAVPREIREGERRVALVPESCRKLVKAGIEVTVESGAGSAAFFPDDTYREAGASVGENAASVLGRAPALSG